MRISDWSSDVCSSDLALELVGDAHGVELGGDVGRLFAGKAAVERGPGRSGGPLHEHHAADESSGDGHEEHGLLAAGEAVEQAAGAVLQLGEIDAGHQSGMFMIDWKASTALLRTATVSSVAREASAAAMV